MPIDRAELSSCLKSRSEHIQVASPAANPVEASESVQARKGRGGGGAINCVGIDNATPAPAPPPARLGGPLAAAHNGAKI